MLCVLKTASTPCFRVCSSLATLWKVVGHMSSRSSSMSGPKNDKKSKPTSDDSDVKVILNGGVFWDIENIPVKKVMAVKRVPEIKKAITHLVTQINHYGEALPPKKQITKFLAVARQKGEATPATTAEVVKKQLIENQIELLDLPFKNDPDYCDDAIFECVAEFTQEHMKCMVVTLTGDVGLVRRINNIKRDFDLIVVMNRAGKSTAVMQRHCDKIKQTNERGRQQTVYFVDEVVRKCANGGIPLTFSHLLRIQSSRTKDLPPLDNHHFNRLFLQDGETIDEGSETDESIDGMDVDSDSISSSLRDSMASSDDD